MKFSVTHNYAHPADEVFVALTDFPTIRAKYEALGQSAIELIRRDQNDDGTVTIVTRRVVPLELPGFAKRVLSPRQTVIQTDTWSSPDAKGTRTGTFTVDAKGTPVKLGGTLRLARSGARKCTNTTDVTIECRLPLVGGKIADLVADDTRRAVDHEQTWLREHLAKR
jgi:hypothetical protein